MPTYPALPSMKTTSTNLNNFDRQGQKTSLGLGSDMSEDHLPGTDGGFGSVYGPVKGSARSVKLSAVTGPLPLDDFLKYRIEPPAATASATVTAAVPQSARCGWNTRTNQRIQITAPRFSVPRSPIRRQVIPSGLPPQCGHTGASAPEKNAAPQCEHTTSRMALLIQQLPPPPLLFVAPNTATGTYHVRMATSLDVRGL